VRYFGIMVVSNSSSRLGFFAFGALWTVLLAGIALLAITGMFWWQAWNLSIRAIESSPHSVEAEQKVLEKTLDAYKTQVDDLERLVSLLIGLSSFYALILGVSSYYTAQHFVDRSKDSADEVEKNREEMEKAIPAFVDFGKHIDDGLDKLILLLPNEEERDEFWEKLDERDKQEILFLERSMAIVEHLDFKEMKVPVLYQKLGKFYSAWYAVEKEDEANLNPSGRKLTVVRDFAIRAFFYLERAVQRDPKNFTAMNDFGLACIDMSKLPPTKSLGSPEEYLRRAESTWDQSLRIHPQQQRARYNKANSLKRKGQIKQAHEELQEALKYNTWQNEPSPIHLKDIHYNLACYESLLGDQQERGGQDWTQFLDKASENLLAGCEHYKSQPRVRKETLKALGDDCGNGGDLFWLARKRPSLVDQAKKMLL
jgi:tetratricopeptide (TPR) repeat protein